MNWPHLHAPLVFRRELRVGAWLLIALAGPGFALAAEHPTESPKPASVTEAAPGQPAETNTPILKSARPERSGPAAPETLPNLEAAKLQLTARTPHPESVPFIPTRALSADAPASPPIPALAGTNTPADLAGFDPATVERLKLHLEAARYLRNSQRGADAAPMLIDLLGEKSPDFIKKSALLELAAAAQDENNLPRAQQIYGQYLNRWPDDQYIPEILLRQGHLFRRIGLHNLALAKFYAVMTSALVLKHDQLEYYARLVTQAQIEVAETHYQLEKYPEAAEFLTRLLKQDSPLINKADAQYKLVRCLDATGKYDEAVSQGQDFLTRYPGATEQAEVRFHLALALKQLGRNNESLAQVLALLREQSAKARSEPETWAYWQQRTGNLIANQLYREGDFPRALDIYLSLAQLDRSPAWQLPVWYQIGMTYEHLWQPQKAVEIYNEILSRQPELPASAPPGLKAVVEMARWRVGFVEWQHKAENINHSFHGTNAPAPVGHQAWNDSGATGKRSGNESLTLGTRPAVPGSPPPLAIKN